MLWVDGAGVTDLNRLANRRTTYDITTNTVTTTYDRLGVQFSCDEFPPATYVFLFRS